MDLLELSATALSRLIAAREVKPSEVMEATLARVAAVNGTVNAIVSMPDGDALMDQARAADGATRAGWLHGVPMAVKDLMAVQGIRTTWGSPLFADHVPEKDDLLVARMRRRGRFSSARPIRRNGGMGAIPSTRCMG